MRGRQGGEGWRELGGCGPPETSGRLSPDAIAWQVCSVSLCPVLWHAVCNILRETAMSQPRSAMAGSYTR